jgi:hypothetical protein
MCGCTADEHGVIYDRDGKMLMSYANRCRFYEEVEKPKLLANGERVAELEQRLGRVEQAAEVLEAQLDRPTCKRCGRFMDMITEDD